MTTIRELTRISAGQPVTDGDGVKITRFIGNQELNMLDPFLLFDVFESDQASDYLGGFPSHPHRGFETVTYLLAGRMRHKDSAGHEGVIEPGGVQWMTSGSGIVHSEMPEQEHGLLQGFQIWLNLPAAKKMHKPRYQEFPAKEIYIQSDDKGTEVRVISGMTNKGIMGPVVNHYVNPLFLDITLQADNEFIQDIENNANGFIFVIEGRLTVGASHGNLDKHQLGVLAKGDQVVITAKTKSHFLLLTASPLNEPVVRGGPFVMNTKAEVLQAFEDYQNNTLLGD